MKTKAFSKSNRLLRHGKVAKTIKSYPFVGLLLLPCINVYSLILEHPKCSGKGHPFRGRSVAETRSNGRIEVAHTVITVAQ